MSMMRQFQELARKNPNDMELGSVIRSAIQKLDADKRFCNFCHAETYTKEEDCVDCGFSKPYKEKLQ